MRALVPFLLAGAALVTACEAPQDDIDVDAIRETARESARAGDVTAAEFGDDWPFTVDSGRLSCRAPRQALFYANGRTYPLNGAASARSMDHGYASLDRIWRDNPDIPGTKISVGPMISRALELC
ncbi:DUF2511 domain-containing protein [Hyphobacterium marinum]|uniref:DUF2511 domain-containing protein n=1 Tax=Hyphobacterium marinum TaxID=3116574 RepID=A0ABU7LYJ1_9PROT|nr:DUF2511 domain-containing protein [Hyphobacterium sp. Y6023]MEE2566623.1 DUF2511 domain-containing protein [Hyphobacterium sp. Y6023]